MFENIWNKIKEKSILSYTDSYNLFQQIIPLINISGSTAEIGVYEGTTSKLIINTLNKKHYCYDTFDGIIGSSIIDGDYHHDKEFICNLDKVKLNINEENVIYKIGEFPNTFEEYNGKFCLVYSDTATYIGTINTFNYLHHNIISGGKIIFYMDDKSNGIKKAIDEILIYPMIINFTVIYIHHFIIFMKK